MNKCFEFVLASKNRKKIQELEQILSQKLGEVKILSLDDIGYTDEIEENGNSFAENSYIKASVPAKLGYAGIADDSGLCVDALKGAPGIYSARYSGTDENKDENNNKKLLSELDGITFENRTARYECVITCVFPNGDKVSGYGKVDGIILTEGIGDNGFGYDPLFYYEPYKKTFAQLDADEKNSISHRGAAIENFAKELSKYLNKPNNERNY